MLGYGYLRQVQPRHCYLFLSPVRAPTKVCHYRICMAPSGGLYLQEGRLFPSLDALLDYYKTNWKLIQNPLLQPCIPQVDLRQSPYLGTTEDPILESPSGLDLAREYPVSMASSF